MMSGPAAPVLPPVIRDVPGQEHAAAFLARAAAHPHHAYLFSGPEGSGKRLGMRAFAASLLCATGGCGGCRDCRLALGETHPNMLVLEPTGPDILVGRDGQDPNTARWFASWGVRTPPEPGRKVMVVLQADRMRPEAADVLLKFLEEPPEDTVIVLLSARPDEVPETVRSRCHEIAFPPLGEEFVVESLVREGLDESRARLASRLAGGNVGRARRVARDEQGLAFRDVALAAAGRAASGPAGALAAAEMVDGASKEYQGRLAEELKLELTAFLDEKGRVQDQFRGLVRRLQDGHDRRLRRARLEFLDWSLLSLAAFYRDQVVGGVGGGDDLLINLDRPEGLGAGERLPAPAAARAMGAVEEARADLADEINLNAKLLLERLFLRLSSLGAA